MAFTYNSGGKVTGDSSANPIQFNYTAGANSRLVVLALSFHTNGAGGTTAAPTYNGIAMQQVGATQTSAEGATELWYTLSPDASTSRQISITNGNSEDCSYACSDFAHATNSAALFGSDTQSSGSGANVVATVASVPDGAACVSAMVHGEKDQFASVSVLTSFWAGPSVDRGSNQIGSGYSIQSGTANEVHTYTSGGSSDDFNYVMGAWQEQAASTPLVGSTGGTSTAAGAVDSGESLAGSAGATSTAAGAIAAAESVVGTCDGLSTAAAALGEGWGLVGTVDGQSSATGDVGKKWSLVGTSDGQSSAAGAIAEGAGLTGSADGLSATAGVLGEGWLLVGTVGGQSSAEGVLGEGWLLVGTADGQSSASGILGEGWLLVGTSDGQSSATGDIGEGLSLVGTSDGQSSASAALSEGGDDESLTGTSDGQSSASGALSEGASLTGTAGAASGASGVLGEGWLLVGAAGAQSSAAGGLGEGWLLAGTVDGQSSATGAIGESGGGSSLIGSLGATSTAAGGIAESASIVGTCEVVTTAAGAIAEVGGLLGSSAAVSYAVASLTEGAVAGPPDIHTPHQLALQHSGSALSDTTNAPRSGVVLSWDVIANADTYDVYFGKNRSAIENDDETTFLGNQSARTYTLGRLKSGTTYFWRIDAVNAHGTSRGSI